MPRLLAFIRSAAPNLRQPPDGLTTIKVVRAQRDFNFETGSETDLQGTCAPLMKRAIKGIPRGISLLFKRLAQSRNDGFFNEDLI
jgi:hypothetical protein